MNMKKLFKVILLSLVITTTFLICPKNKFVLIENKSLSNKKTPNTLSMNFETTAGSGEYITSTNNNWPAEGYTFNKELSRCENGSEINWDDTNRKVVVKANVSDKCYVYFDKLKPTLAEHVKSLYTSQGTNNLYHHDSTLTNGANDNSYRYSGSYETTQNWVCFGQEDSTGNYASGWCDDEHLYRIIGVFDSTIVDENGNSTEQKEERVKLIKAYEGTETSLGTTSAGYGSKNTTYYKGKLDQIPGYYWDSNGSNNWGASSLNLNILNGTYLTKLGSTWISKIAVTEWSVGGGTFYTFGMSSSSRAYTSEVINTNNNKKVYNEIGLMYISDYGFAASSDNWTKVLGYYPDDSKRNNWLFMGINEWTITSDTDTSRGSNIYAFTVGSGVLVSEETVNSSSCGVRPAFYLNYNVILSGGSGTELDPYRIN